MYATRAIDGMTATYETATTMLSVAAHIRQA
jgi:hypothetical protein